MNELDISNSTGIIKHKTGRPMKFQTLDDLQRGIDSYFSYCKDKCIPLTITGLALSLDTTRETLCDYENKSIYSDAVKRAKEMIANYCEIQCLTARNPAGAIFLAKNHGFTDKQEIDHTIQHKTITVEMLGSIDD